MLSRFCNQREALIPKFRLGIQFHKIFVEQFDNKFQYLYSENARINPDGGFDYGDMTVSFSTYSYPQSI
jgi:hypothetical protein